MDVKISNDLELTCKKPIYKIFDFKFNSNWVSILLHTTKCNYLTVSSAEPDAKIEDSAEKSRDQTGFLWPEKVDIFLLDPKSQRIILLSSPISIKIIKIPNSIV